jgi:hypothetical protein
MNRNVKTSSFFTSTISFNNGLEKTHLDQPDKKALSEILQMTKLDPSLYPNASPEELDALEKEFESYPDEIEEDALLNDLKDDNTTFMPRIFEEEESLKKKDKKRREKLEIKKLTNGPKKPHISLVDDTRLYPFIPLPEPDSSAIREFVSLNPFRYCWIIFKT